MTEPDESAEHSVYLDMLIARYVKVMHELQVLERQKDELTDLIFIEGRMPPGTRRGGIVVARVTRFDPEQARRILPPEDYEAICERVPRVKLAEKLLDPEVLAECRRPGRSYLRLVE